MKIEKTKSFNSRIAMKKSLLTISLLLAGSLTALEGNLPTGTINPMVGTQAQTGYQAKPEIGYQAPNAGTEAQVGYQAGTNSELSTAVMPFDSESRTAVEPFTNDETTRAEALKLPKPELL